MPRESNAKPVKEGGVATEATENTPKNQEPKYKIEKLRAHCMKLFSISVSTFDGAMYGVKETELTVKEAGAKINKWLGRKE